MSKAPHTVSLPSETNQLFPVFLKLEQLHVLIVGGGNVGLEKATTLLTNSPKVKITLVAEKVLHAIKALKNECNRLVIIERSLNLSDFDDKDLIIAATGNRTVSEWIRVEAEKRKILLNVADTPDLCDFYLGSIVQKGDLKIAISTNGKSPTLAKRLKEVFNEALPADTQLSIHQLNRFRSQLTGDFADKVKRLNELTAVLVNKKDKNLWYFTKQIMSILYTYSAALVSSTKVFLGSIHYEFRRTK